MPTLKQKVAYKKTIENNGSVSKAMRETGYSLNTAKNPQSLTESKGWKELMNTYLPDELLGKKHRQLLNKVDKGTKEPETQAVSKALDMAYKLKDRYPKNNDLTAIQIN